MAAAPPTEWDAQAYHRVSTPQFAWGQKVLERLPLKGDETVLDAGCGSGRLSEKILERIPKGQLIALDSSANMLREAKSTLSSYGAHVTFVKADLAELDLDRVADAVFSTATFHWVHDHDALFAGLLRALKPGGRLVAQCGAAGNLAVLHDGAVALMKTPAFASHFTAWKDPWHYAAPEETAERLLHKGFVDVKVWTEPAPTPFATALEYRQFVQSVVLRVHVDQLPTEALQARFLDEIVAKAEASAPKLTLDYVRLNIDAARPA